jgi:hypothetical protein
MNGLDRLILAAIRYAEAAQQDAFAAQGEPLTQLAAAAVAYAKIKVKP